MYSVLAVQIFSNDRPPTVAISWYGVLACFIMASETGLQDASSACAGALAMTPIKTDAANAYMKWVQWHDMAWPLDAAEESSAVMLTD
jgi:hypothetical protein